MPYVPVGKSSPRDGGCGRFAGLVETDGERLLLERFQEFGPVRAVIARVVLLFLD